MAKTQQSKKAKGSRWEKRIAIYYRRLGIEARRMPMSGAISMMRGDIFKRERDGWVDECKNQEKVCLWKWWRQTEAQCRFGERPVLHITRNRGAELSVIKTEDWFAMRKEIKELKAEVMDCGEGVDKKVDKLK